MNFMMRWKWNGANRRPLNSSHSRFSNFFCYLFSCHMLPNTIRALLKCQMSECCWRAHHCTIISRCQLLTSLFVSLFCRHCVIFTHSEESDSSSEMIIAQSWSHSESLPFIPKANAVILCANDKMKHMHYRISDER